MKSARNEVLAERIEELIAAHGGLSQLASALGIDKGYLSRLKDGSKDSPGDDILQKLGLYRVVEFRRVPQLQLRTKSA